MPLTAASSSSSTSPNHPCAVCQKGFSFFAKKRQCQHCGEGLHDKCLPKHLSTTCPSSPTTSSSTSPLSTPNGPTSPTTPSASLADQYLRMMMAENASSDPSAPGQLPSDFVYTPPPPPPQFFFAFPREGKAGEEASPSPSWEELLGEWDKWKSDSAPQEAFPFIDLLHHWHSNVKAVDDMEKSRASEGKEPAAKVALAEEFPDLLGDAPPISPPAPSSPSFPSAPSFSSLIDDYFFPIQRTLYGTVADLTSELEAQVAEARHQRKLVLLDLCLLCPSSSLQKVALLFFIRRRLVADCHRYVWVHEEELMAFEEKEGEAVSRAGPDPLIAGAPPAVGGEEGRAPIRPLSAVRALPTAPPSEGRGAGGVEAAACTIPCGCGVDVEPLYGDCACDASGE